MARPALDGPAVAVGAATGPAVGPDGPERVAAVVASTAILREKVGD